jgi:hypothetical protein
VLSVPVGVYRQNTLALGDFGKWMVKHINHWFVFAKNLGLGIEHMEEIVLVTGCDRTRSWTNVVFFGDEGEAEAPFGVDVVDSPEPSVKWYSSPERIRGALLSQGPEGTVYYAPFSWDSGSDTALMRCDHRTYPRISAYSSEGSASLVPSGSYQSISKRRQEPLQIRTRMIMIRNQPQNLYHYHLPPR